MHIDNNVVSGVWMAVVSYVKYYCSNQVEFRYWRLCFFFFKQKTAYEMLRSLVGSEMCIRDRFLVMPVRYEDYGCSAHPRELWTSPCFEKGGPSDSCLLYTSDAADDLLCVDLGGCRIITKKTNNKTHHTTCINK